MIDIDYLKSLTEEEEEELIELIETYHELQIPDTDIAKK